MAIVYPRNINLSVSVATSNAQILIFIQMVYSIRPFGPYGILSLHLLDKGPYVNFFNYPGIAVRLQPCCTVRNLKKVMGIFFDSRFQYFKIGYSMFLSLVLLGLSFLLLLLGPLTLCHSITDAAQTSTLPLYVMS